MANGRVHLTTRKKMNRGKVIEILLDDIVRRVDVEHPFAQEWKDDYDLERGSLSQSIALCMEIAQQPYKKIIEYLNDAVNNPDGFDLYADVTELPYYTRNISDPTQLAKLRSVRTNSDPYVVTLEIFGSKDNVEVDDNNWIVWERIWASINGDIDKADAFWNDLLSERRSMIFIHTELPNIDEKKMWQIYSYAYMSYVKEDKFPIPGELAACGSLLTTDILAYKENAKYEQFFDVYDVLNEVKYAPDLLTEFVKIYQVIEMLAYRRKFQKVITAHMQNHYPIVRQIESITENFKKSEIDEIEDLFKDCFADIKNQLDPEIGGAYPATIDYLHADCIAFIGDKYGVRTGGNGVHPAYSDGSIGRIVYRIRCSIVHNKETEFHFMYNNYHEYKAIVPLIRKLNQLLFAAILELINEGTKLLYIADYLKLY